MLLNGIEIINNKRIIIVNKIKNIVVEMIHFSKDLILTNFSTYLSEKMEYDYTYLSNVFSASESISIEHFIILNKIEKVKELLSYEDLKEIH